MRALAIALVATVVASGAAVATPDQSAFDGTYNGMLTPAPAFEQRACSPQDVTSLRVNSGEIQQEPGLPSFSGTINAKGFVEGYMNKADGSKVPIQGRAVASDDGKVHVSAGVLDNAAGCAWTLDLARQ